MTTSAAGGAAASVIPPSSSLSRDLDSLSVRVTRLPASVTNLVQCVAHEIGIIEQELEDSYNGDRNDNDNENENENENKNKNKNKNKNNSNQESLEDAIDDGFMCVDLKVLERKLQVWHALFSPEFETAASSTSTTSSSTCEYTYTVTPFFAVKCNPDPLVVEWLARTSREYNLPLGFDCASIAELELAKTNIQQYQLHRVNGSHSNNKSNDNNDNQKQVPLTRIIYANPQRAEADLIQAMELFATQDTTSDTTNSNNNNDDDMASELWLTLDGVEEIYKIAIAKERFKHKHFGSAWIMPTIKIVLRIWVPDGHSQVPLGEKFGMRLDQVDQLVQACLEQQIRAQDIIGVSFHCGSGCESVETYLEALEMGKKALEAMDQQLLLVDPSSSQAIQHRCWLMDIGGGFPGLDGLYGDEGRFAAETISTYAAKEIKKEANEESQTKVANIAVAVQSPLQSFSTGNPPLTLIAEPGRYFVEAGFALASRIYQKQLIDGIRVYRIPHGVQGVFKDVLLCGESFVPQPLQICPKHFQKDPLLLESKILGPSGDDSEDIVCASCWLPELEIGDWLVFDRMGAYTLSIASRAGRPVMRYVMGGGCETAIETKYGLTPS